MVRDAGDKDTFGPPLTNPKQRWIGTVYIYKTYIYLYTQRVYLCVYGCVCVGKMMASKKYREKDKGAQKEKDRVMIRDYILLYIHRGK